MLKYTNTFRPLTNATFAVRFVQLRMARIVVLFILTKRLIFETKKLIFSKKYEKIYFLLFKKCSNPFGERLVTLYGIDTEIFVQSLNKLLLYIAICLSELNLQASLFMNVVILVLLDTEC